MHDEYEFQFLKGSPVPLIPYVPDCVHADCPHDGIENATIYGAMCPAHLKGFQTRFDQFPRQEYVFRLRPSVTDERGTITNLFNGSLGHVAIITCAPGAIRAKHYHPPGNHQIMYALKGDYLATSQEVDPKGLLVPGTRRVQWVREGCVAEVPSMLAHGYYWPGACDDEYTHLTSIFLNLNLQARHLEGYGKHTLPMPSLEVATKLEE